DLQGRATLGGQHTRTAPLPFFTHAETVDCEIEQVAQPIAAITASVAQAIHPAVVVQRLILIEFDIRPSQADLVAVDAGEVGLTADAAGIAAIERVIPDVQFPDAGRVDGRDKVAGVVHDVDDVFVGPNAIEFGHVQSWQLLGRHLQSPTAV